ncbi:MAG: hypothetical protein JXQ87_11200 [Bacteroidia bacterium]
MTPDLELYRQMVLGHESPRAQREVTESRYKELLNDLKDADYKYQPKYKVQFDKPITAKRKYFKKKIDNAAVEYLNAIYEAVRTSKAENQKTYHVYTALTRTLPSIMTDLCDLIYNYGYTELGYGSIGGHYSFNSSTDEPYVFYYLEHQLIRLYLEISETYVDYRKDENLEIDELYIKYFRIPQPQEAKIVAAPEYKVDRAELEVVEHKPEGQFKIMHGDFSAKNDKIIDYLKIVKKPRQFGRVEELFYQQGYIDENYTFIGKHGTKTHWAILYSILIDKGYFNERAFDPNRKIEETDIVRFLDYRYNVAPSTDKLFRIHRQDFKKIADFQDKNFWTRHILPCK